MPSAPHERVFRATIDGYVTKLDAELIGRASVVLGGGRDKVDDEIDPGVGIMLAATMGDRVRAGDEILLIQYRDESRCRAARALLTQAVKVADAANRSMPLIIDEVV